VASSIYLINPAADFPTYFNAEVYSGMGLPAVTMMADLAMPTVAAMVPSGFAVVVCDEMLSPVDYDTPADVVGLTGKITQRGRMVAHAEEFRRRGKLVMIGGPYASLCPELLRPHCDILVRGEFEDVAATLFDDLQRGAWKDEYVGGKPDLAVSPRPRWDLYPNERALMGTLQTARGCPFECEFCDVIVYVGRKQRHKPVTHVLAELDGLYRHGYRSVFLADDNFTVYRARAKELLAALRDWNRAQQDGQMDFVTQASIDAAKDPELLQMCAEAGLTHLFIGIETINDDSLREAKKRQNLRVNLADQVQRILDNGICVSGGMIVGFDADDVAVFDRQYEFVMAAAIPIFSVGALVAPAATPLHRRMQEANRLVEDGSEVAAMPWNTNIVPGGMSRDELLRGLRWLCNRIYQPSSFGERMVHLIQRLGPRRDPRFLRGGAQRREFRPVDAHSLKLLGRLLASGAEEQQMYRRIQKAIAAQPAAAGLVMPMLIQYMQIRYMYDRGQFWDPLAGSQPAPFGAETHRGARAEH
jgi:radical SAM superfamily enzyme YgiQ (UPF0313 family)